MYKHNELVFPSNMEKNTRFLAIAGFSLNGPVGTPFIIKRDTDPVQVLGECRLAENVLMARKHGITPLILRLNGSHGECTLKHDATGSEALRFRTLEATDEANNIDLQVFPTHLVVKGIRTSQSYLFADYKSLDALAMAIKQSLVFGAGEVDVEVVNSLPLEGLCLEEKHLEFSGADDGMNYVSNHDESDAEEKIQLQLALLKESLLEEDGEITLFTGELSGFQVDTLVFTDIPFEKAPLELVSILGRFAQTKSTDQYVFCSAVLGSDYFGSGRYEEEGEDTYAEPLQHLAEAAALIRNEGELLQHVEVVIGAHQSINPLYLSAPCATVYACMRYNLPEFYVSGTNKALEQINSLQSVELSQNEVANLTGSGYICIVPSISKGFVPFASKNLYPQNTLRNKPHYLRSIHFDVNRIASFFNDHIGVPTSYTALQTIATQVNTFIEDLKDEHPIYNNVVLEVLDFDQETLHLSIAFELFGEIEQVRTSFEYITANEVNIEWL